MQPSPFGSHLQKLRKKAQLTQEELGNKVGKHGSYISQIERGHRPPPRNMNLYSILKEALSLSKQDYEELVTLASPIPLLVFDEYEPDVMESLLPMEVAFALERHDLTPEEKILFKEDIQHAVRNVLRYWSERRTRHRLGEQPP